ncbi:hypothetical protein JZ751_007563 [Albula glossodonta]|uniref:ETS-related transcription factor Elf-3-like n=1 Tax=Albula glossodonta TaxID=121402 RepID=A0A8T2N501_9TELE|nr:hypothetical protein JZ751_007563 [Albula glossodonta]
MSGSCNLSSILTSANWAMNGSLEPLQAESGTAFPLSSEPLLPLSNAYFSTAYSAQETDKWYCKPPQQWSTRNILEWIGHHVEDSQFDGNTLDLVSCTMDGPTLCQLPRDKLVSMFGGPLGERLFGHLLDLKAKYGAGDLSLTCDFFNSLFEEYPEIMNVSGGDAGYDILTSDINSGLSIYINQGGVKPEGDMTPMSDYGYESSQDSLDRSCAETLRFPSPSSPDSVGTDSEQDLTEERLPHFTKGEVKRRRGRPKKNFLTAGSGSEHLRSKKNKHAPRGTHLWEFIRDILIHPEQHGGLMRWEDRREGVFKFLKSEAVAQLWGQKKRNSSMNYEKLSRAMRYYYKREILDRVDGRRLVYKFGKNSTGWRLGEVGV